MTSKFLIPLKLLNITATPANPTAGFVSLYMKNNYLTSLSSSGVVLDVVLDRPLTGFVAIAPAPIIAADTVLIAFEKLQSQINTITSGGAGQPDEYYQDLIFNAITAGTGISINYNDAGGTFDISSSITQGPIGSGTLNRVAKWTPNGTTLGNSLIHDDNVSVYLGRLDYNVSFSVQTSTLAAAIRAESETPNGSSGIVGLSTGSGSGPNIGVGGVAGYSSNTNIGVSGSSIVSDGALNIGISGYATGATKNHAAKLQDPTSGVIGRYLRNMSVDGLASWVNITTADISDYTAYTLPTASNSVLGGVKVGSGLSIDGSGILSVIPTTTYDDTIFFDKLTPTTSGVVFTPNTPATLNMLYVSSVDSSTWIWNGSTYVTEPVPVINTAWYLANTTLDAGGDKTGYIQRLGGIILANTTNTALATSVTSIDISNGISVSSQANASLSLESVSTSNSPSFLLKRTRGTRSAKTDVLNGDRLGTVYFSGKSPNASVYFMVNATEDHDSTLHNYGARFDIHVRSNSEGTTATPPSRFSILETGKVAFASNAYRFPLADGTSTQVLATDGAGNLAWTTIAGGTTLAGAGTNNYIARWTPNGSTLGIGVIQDDGARVGIGTTPGFNNRLFIVSGTLDTGVMALTTADSGKGIHGQSDGGGTYSFGIYGKAGSAALRNTGVRGDASSTTGTIGIGGSFIVGGVGTKYGLEIQDGTEGVGKFLKSVTAFGLSNWANITAADISGGVVGGSGTTNYLAKWTPNGSALGNSMLQDNGTTMSVNTPPTNTYGFHFRYSSGQSSIFGENSYAGAGDSAGVVGVGNGVVTGTNYGGLFNAVNNVALNIGVKGGATGVTAGTNVGGLFHATNGASNYAIQLLDSTSTVANRFLKNMTTDGKAKWETSFTIDTNKVAKFEGQVVSLLSTNNAPTGTTQTINWNSGNSQTMALGSATGNVALTFTNPVAGATYFLRIVQGATPRQISFSTIVKFPGGTAPTLTATANAVDTIVIFYDGVSYFGNYSLNYI